MIAALLLLVLAFAGYWIMEYADPSNPDEPWALVPWFLAGGGVIIAVGIVVFLRAQQRFGRAVAAKPARARRQ